MCSLQEGAWNCAGFEELAWNFEGNYVLDGIRHRKSKS